MRRGRRQGRQEQIIPTLISTEDQVAAGGFSKVGSVEFDIPTREWRRRTETMQPLGKVLAS
jgi:hypothetical protein